MELWEKILNISIHIRIIGISDIALITLAVGSFGVSASDDFNSVPLIKNVSINTKGTWLSKFDYQNLWQINY